MAAPEMTVFFPEGFDKAAALRDVVEELSLTVDHLPAGWPCEFSAQRRQDDMYLLVEYDANADDVIDELAEWEKPTDEYKRILSNCRSSLTIHYRGIDNAKCCLLVLANVAGPLTSRCVVENGKGCLLLLGDVADRLASDPSWSWERELFPELSGVAASEWLA